MRQTRIPKGLIVRGLVAVVLLGTIFLLQADLTETLRLVKNADWRYLAAALALAILGEVVTAWKLKLLFEGVGARPSMGLVVRSCFIAMFYNNILPGSVGGDIARVFLLAKAAGGKAMAAAGVFMQRNTGLGGLLVVALAASLVPPFRLGRFGGMLEWLDYAVVWFLGVAAGFGAINAVLVSERLYERVWGVLRKLLGQRAGVEGAGVDEVDQVDAVDQVDRVKPVEGGNAGRAGHSGWLRFGGKVRRGVEVVAEKLQRLHGAVRMFRGGWGVALVLSVITQLIDCGLVMLAGLSLGLELPFQFLCICVPAVSLAALMPVTINGIGLREQVYIFFLLRIGVGQEYAVALSLLHFGVFVTMGAIGGVLQWGETRGEEKRNAKTPGR